MEFEPWMWTVEEWCAPWINRFKYCANNEERAQLYLAAINRLVKDIQVFPSASEAMDYFAQCSGILLKEINGEV